MRILHVFDHSVPLQSGYVTRSLGIIRSQRLRGWQTVHVTGPKQLTTGATFETVDGLDFYRTPKVEIAWPFMREILEMRSTRARLIEIVRREKPDVIHAHSPVLNVLPAITVARKFGLPIIYEVRALWEDAAVDHGTARAGDLRYRLSRMLDTWAMRQVNYVAPICEPLRQEIISRGIAPSRVAVVPNSVDRSFLTVEHPLPGEAELLSNLGIRGRTVLGFIGSFYSYEGLELLLRAAVKMRNSGTSFCILLVGGGPDEAHLKALADELNLGDCVRFIGRVHHDEVARYYRLIDLLVFPRKRMRLTELVTPLKPLEAMAQMKPVLASDVGGHKELIRDSETGYLFPADDIDALASSLEKIIADPSGRAKIAAAGRKHVEAERTWDRLVERYQNIYEGVGLKP